jgi:HSP20 family protein
MLTVKGQRKEDGSANARRYVAQEIGLGPFSRSFGFPAYIDPDKVSAFYRDGVLGMSVPKRQKAKPRRIEIS